MPALLRHPLTIILGSFVLGLLLFLWMWTGINNKEAAVANPVDISGDVEEVVFRPLPGPMPANIDVDPVAMGGAAIVAEVVPDEVVLAEASVEGLPLAVEDVLSVRSPRSVDDRALPVVLAGNRQPEYPGSALRRGKGGTVVLYVEVGADGLAEDVRILQRSGTRALDRAARNAVERWRFEPARVDGVPVAAGLEVPVVFDPSPEA